MKVHNNLEKKKFAERINSLGDTLFKNDEEQERLKKEIRRVIADFCGVPVKECG